ncbi:hypothetical protein [uncultured Sulfitobacter sp.]|uniref:hypothetical protein n=1 Tax=uncultured Sulfitobacter sp. TaxID=191468 RepID=UPI002627AAF4|nr:hypothetical protein [uncultured Sulfitobacter sp.]
MRVFAALFIGLGLAACGDPLAGVDRLSDVDIVATDPVAAALPDAEEVAREGFLGTEAAQGEIPEGVDALQNQESAHRGLFAGLFGSIGAKSQDDEVEKLAALPSPERQSDAAPVQEEPVRTKARADSGPDARDVPFGAVLAFGEVARVCDARGKSLGNKVAQIGKRGIALYDSNPGNMSKRTFYLTGFGDNCPRQFTAANALFGPPSFYEQLRFGPAGGNLPYAETDKAYDGIKSKVCRAGKSKPCGGKIGRLEADTAFLSAYEFNEHNGKWKEFLIHGGDIVAAALKKLN